MLGVEEGLTVGEVLGFPLGVSLGLPDVGLLESKALDCEGGVVLGVDEGLSVGDALGIPLGISLRLPDGCNDG